jgi:hypothetical protein
MAKGKKTGGRQKGVPNRVTTSVKQAITDAFDELGGVPSLVAWGKKNPNEFYGLWGRLAPREVHADVTVKLSPEERARRVAQILGVAK